MRNIVTNAWTPGAGRFNLEAGGKTMAYVITEPCVGVKDQACVEVCPMDCIHAEEADAQMFINPAECIDCGACASECPVEAIYYENEVLEKWKHYIALNAAHYD
jgi:ferredoxin